MAASAIAKWWRLWRQRVRSVQNYCSPERSSRAGHRFWVFLIGSQGFASCPTKCFIKSSTVLTPFTSSFLQFRAAEVMHCAKFSHRRCFLAKQERKLHIKSFPEKRNKEVLLSVAVESWIWSAPAISSFWRLWRREVASRGNAFWKSCNSWLFRAKQERKLHNKSSADKELVAFIFWEALLLVGASLAQRVLLTRPWLQERRDLNVTKLQKRIANVFEALPIMRSCFLRSSKAFQNGGHSWAHGGNGHYCKILETLATKGGQQRQCVFENLATADSLGQSRRGNCTTRALLIRNWLLSFSGKSCFLWGLPLRKGFFWQGPDCKREEILMLPSYKNGLQTCSKHCQ